MTRKQFLMFAAIAPSAVRAFADNLKLPRLEDALTAELCSANAPKILYGQFTRNLSGFDPGIFSEAGEDHFYEVYTQKLRPLVDERFVNVRSYRPALLDAFLGVNRFLDLVFRDGTGFGHQEKRIPGQIEWEIMQGESTKFNHTWIDAYFHEDILTIGHIVARAKFEKQGPEDGDTIERLMIPELRRAIEYLKQAEAHLSKDGQLFFRRRLLKHIADMM